MKLKSHDQFIIEHYGEIGTHKRDVFERGYERFKLGVNLQNGNQKRLPRKLKKKLKTR